MRIMQNGIFYVNRGGDSDSSIGFMTHLFQKIFNASEKAIHLTEQRACGHTFI